MKADEVRLYALRGGLKKQSVCYTHFHSNKVFRGDSYYGRRLQRKNPLGGNVFRIALRDDTDVILIGEMRDYETISLAMMAAETGHLVFGTLHTSSAAQTFDRIIDVCPIHAQARYATSFQICFRALSRRASFRTLTGRGASLRLRSCSARTR